MSKKTVATAICVALILLAGGIFAYQQGWFTAIQASSTPTPSPTPSSTPTPSPTPSSTPTPSPTPSSTPTPSPTPTVFQPPDGKCYIGVWRDGILTYDALGSFINDTEAKSGKRVAILAIYSLFDPTSSTYQNPVERLKAAESLYRNGRISAIALGWNPWNPAIFKDSQSDTQTITKIANGDYDNYLRIVAQGLKASLAAPLSIRFGSEMNGQWHGYGYDHNVYIKAWRRIHDIFREIEVRADWIFHPANQPPGQYPQWYPNRRPWKDYYPGDAYVDWIGVSWHSFSLWGMGKEKTIDQWFAEGEYLEFAKEHNKPFIFSEVGTDGSLVPRYGVPVWYQVRHINQLFDFINHHNEVKAFMWYDLPYTLSIPETLAAYRQGIADPRYISKSPNTDP